jgi:YidC/Oxa1 family membrane protein insertase
VLSILLTKDDGVILGPISALLGKIMEWIYDLFSLMNIYSVGLCIIFFTIVVRMLLLPLNIKQQKFSKLSALMNPELQAINKKYKDKRDPESMTKMQEETQMVYKKYGTSPTGGCLQLVIQMPILLALWRVIRNIPAYVPKVKELYENIVTAIGGTDNAFETFKNSGFETTLTNAKSATEVFADCTTDNSVIDVMSQFTSDQWSALKEHFTGAADVITTNVDKLTEANTFLGINLSMTPIAVAGIALIIPVLAILGQWLSIRLSMKLQQNRNGQDMPGMGSMKMMNNIMPFVSGFMCLSLPAGLGLYWIAGSIIQIIQQIFMNRYFEKIDVNEIVEKNVAKENKKREKRGLPPQKITNAAHISTKSIDETKSNKTKPMAEEGKASNTTANSAKSGGGSLAAKANLVQKYSDVKKK